jgi:glyoxylate/hydroxypyruvate reductase A
MRSGQHPSILIHSSIREEDAFLLGELQRARPDLISSIRTANGVDEITALLPEAEILWAYDFPIELLPRGGQLRWFQVMGAGVDHLLGRPEIPHELVITNVKGVFGRSMAEYALTYMLAHSQRIPQVRAQQARHEWTQFEPGPLRGKTAGIVGLGSIGREVAQLCAAVGLRVLGAKRTPGDVPHVERVYTTDELDAMLPECDFLILCVPRTPETTGLLNRERYQLMKPTSVVINMARGSLTPETDLVEAIEQGWIAGAAIDVFEAEPLPPESPLWALRNVFITPHISGVNRPEELIPPFLANLDRYLAGQTLDNLVDLRRGY